MWLSGYVYEGYIAVVKGFVYGLYRGHIGARVRALCLEGLEVTV